MSAHPAPPLQLRPPVAVSCDNKHRTAACTVCRWSEEQVTDSPDMMELLWSHAREHAQDSRHKVTATSVQVMTFDPL